MGRQDEFNKRDYLYVRIADELERDIINGSFPTKKLPSEQELCAKYSVSRTVIREALKILGERHLVMSIVGSGAYISSPDANDLAVVISRMMKMRSIDPTELIDLRIILESNAAIEAAQNATDEELDRMEAVAVQMDDVSMPKDERVALDNQFHMMLCEASHNNMLSLLAQAIHEVVGEFIYSAMYVTDKNPELIQLINHHKIIRTLRERKPASAYSVVHDHLYTTKKLYESYSDPDKGVIFEFLPSTGPGGV